MKRFASGLLLILLLISLAVPVQAADVRPDWSIRSSEYCQSASMAEYRHLFADAERFGLNAFFTRAMAASVLYRLSGEDGAGLSAALPDVDPAAWYGDAALWASSRGVIPASDDGNFYPDWNVTREDLCVCLNNYALYAGVRLKQINAWYSFLDGGTMGNSQRQAVATLQQAGVLIEEHDGFFYPFNTLTVLDAETALLRFIGSLNGSVGGMPLSTVEESAPVDDAWFEDACFVGHSQIVGLANYSNLTTPDYYCCVGFSAQDMLDYRYFQGPDRRYGSLDKIFHNYQNTYRKVYVMLGVNDFSKNTTRVEEFMTPMRKLLDLIRETQPEAKIYMISVAPVGHETPMNILYKYENVEFYSRMVKTLSREYNGEYLDLFSLMADTDGYMLDYYNSGDGIHFKAARYAEIVQFLRTHT
jgi:hypothetical protein